MLGRKSCRERKKSPSTLATLATLPLPALATLPAAQSAAQSWSSAPRSETSLKKNKDSGSALRHSVVKAVANDARHGRLVKVHPTAGAYTRPLFDST